MEELTGVDHKELERQIVRLVEIHHLQREIIESKKEIIRLLKQISIKDATIESYEKAPKNFDISELAIKCGY